ncbi:hypothetical protein [Micromonospora sp. NPDC049274]|uniref:hypothetical protein n=1 Tax=Micromonospora sp. NPDC049274 TaxID=3154829 RepID=UPI003421B8B0
MAAGQRVCAPRQAVDEKRLLGPLGDVERGSWMSDDETATTVWNLVRSGLLDLSAVELLTVGLDNPAAALDLAEHTTGLGFVALVP